MRYTLSFVVAAGLLVAAQPPPAPARRAAAVSPAQVSPVGDPAGIAPSEVVNVEKRWGGADALMPLTQSDAASVRNAAVRAIGRVEDPRLVLPLLALKNVSAAARSD